MWKMCSRIPEDGESQKMLCERIWESFRGVLGVIELVRRSSLLHIIISHFLLHYMTALVICVHVRMFVNETKYFLIGWDALGESQRNVNQDLFANWLHGESNGKHNLAFKRFDKKVKTHMCEYWSWEDTYYFSSHSIENTNVVIDCL